jgi:hypothetical protein
MIEMSKFRSNFYVHTAVFTAAVACGGAVAHTIMTADVALAGESKSSVSEEIYKKLFSKKRSTDTDQKRARTNTAIMGIRGLDDDPDAPIKASANANMRAVYEMEDRTADPTTVEALKARLTAETAKIEKKAFPPAIETTPPTPGEFEGEIDLGRKMAAQVLGANQTFNNRKVSGYVLALTQILADNGLSAGRPFRVAILNSEKINAFACPGGYIFVTKGALKATRNESQLAALLGHEIVHVSKRHLISSLQKKVSKNSESQGKTDSDPVIETRKRVKVESNPDTTAWVQLLGPKGVGLSLLQASSEALDTLLSKGLEKEFELEADRLGQQISSTLGYDPKSLEGFLNQIREKQSGNINNAFSTHPPYDLRIENLSKFVATLIGEGGPTITGSPLYSEMQRELARP